MTARFENQTVATATLDIDDQFASVYVGNCPNLVAIAVNGKNVKFFSAENCPQYEMDLPALVHGCPKLEHAIAYTDGGSLKMWDRGQSVGEYRSQAHYQPPEYDYTQLVSAQEQLEEDYQHYEDAPVRLPVSTPKYLSEDEDMSEDVMLPHQSTTHQYMDEDEYMDEDSFEEDPGYDSY